MALPRWTICLLPPHYVLPLIISPQLPNNETNRPPNTPQKHAHSSKDSEINYLSRDLLSKQPRSHRLHDPDRRRAYRYCPLPQGPVPEMFRIWGISSRQELMHLRLSSHREVERPLSNITGTWRILRSASPVLSI